MSPNGRMLFYDMRAYAESLDQTPEELEELAREQLGVVAPGLRLGDAAESARRSSSSVRPGSAKPDEQRRRSARARIQRGRRASAMSQGKALTTRTSE